MFEEWGFMAPWCDSMQTLLAASGGNVTVWSWGPAYHPVIQFVLPLSKNAAASADQRQALREGLALFAAVGLIDVQAFVYLMKNAKHVQRESLDKVSEEGEQPTFIEVDLIQHLHREDVKDCFWMKEFFVSLCCQLDQHNTSDAFQKAWQEMQLLSTATLLRLDIPICLTMSKCTSVEIRTEVMKAAWPGIGSALNYQRIRWRGSTAPSSRIGIDKENLYRGDYASFVVDSIRANGNLEHNGLGMRSGFVHLLDQLSSCVRFAPLGFSLARREVASELYRAIMGVLIRDICSSTVETRHFLQNGVKMNFRVGFEWEFSALCSALASTQSCNSAHVTMDHDANEKTWQWLAYALFSKRARSRSSVTKITINALSSYSTEILLRIASSDNPERELIASEGLRINDDDQEFHVKEDAVVQLSERMCQKTLTWKSFGAFEGRNVGGAKIMSSEDKESDWVDALIPGVGLCKIHRRDLVQCDHKPSRRPGAILTLQLGLLRPDGRLPELLRLVGSSLQCLHLKLGNDDNADPIFRDLSWVFAVCPHLLELTVRNQTLLAQYFVRAYNRSNARLRHLNCEFDDTRVVAAALCDDSTPLAQHLQWWYCCLDRSVPVVPHRESVEALESMLAVNTTLQYLTVKAKKREVEDFAATLQHHDLEQVYLANDALPMGCKLALLSVFKSRNAPDYFVLLKVFQFAADCSVRKVRVVPRSHGD